MERARITLTKTILNLESQKLICILDKKVDSNTFSEEISLDIPDLINKAIENEREDWNIQDCVDILQELLPDTIELP